jgi:hypothetical protein
MGSLNPGHYTILPGPPSHQLCFVLNHAMASAIPLHPLPTHTNKHTGMDFAGARLCFDLHKLEAGEFLAGSGDGEILLGTFIRPPGSDNPDYCQLCHQPHAGGWRGGMGGWVGGVGWVWAAWGRCWGGGRRRNVCVRGWGLAGDWVSG